MFSGIFFRPALCIIQIIYQNNFKPFCHIYYEYTRYKLRTMRHIVTLDFFITQLTLSLLKKRDADKIKKSNRRMKVERMIHPFVDFSNL